VNSISDETPTQFLGTMLILHQKRQSFCSLQVAQREKVNHAVFTAIAMGELNQ
jgi:hypothetical protein